MVEFITKEDYQFYIKRRIAQLQKERENALGDMERLAIDRELEKLISSINKPMVSG